ncbi:parapinopsin [Biomphalaria glabrata]|nr:parapinopsin [Biomphalaria glabrata]
MANSTELPMSPSTHLAFLFSHLNYSQDVSSLEYALIGSALAAVAAVGTIFNGMAITVFFRYRELRSPTNSFVIALCVCDFFMSVIGAPIPTYYAFMNTSITSSTLCSLDAFTVYFLSCTSIYLLAAISVDRYFIIVKPVSSLVITQKIATLAIFICFSVGLFWALMPLVGWNGYSLEGIGVACSVTWNRPDVLFNSFIIALFLACFLIPLLVMAFCYLSIIFTVRKIFRGAIMKNLKKHYTIECQMIKTVILMIVLFAVSWLPYAIVSFSMAFGSPFNMTRLVETVPALIAKSSCIWNPIVYVSMNSHFRAGFLSLLPCMKKSFPTGDSSKDDYDLGDNQCSKNADPKAAGECSSFKPEDFGNRKQDPTKLGLSSAVTSLYSGKASSTTSFVSADSDKSSYQSPSENPLLGKAVSDNSFTINALTEDLTKQAIRRASDSTVIKQSSNSQYPIEARQARFKKRSLLGKLRTSKIRVSEADQKNKIYPDADSSSHSLSASEAMFQSSSNLDSGNSFCRSSSKIGKVTCEHKEIPACLDAESWAGQNNDIVTIRVTKSLSQSDAVSQPSDILRRSSVPESSTYVLEGRLSTQC